MNPFSSGDGNSIAGSNMNGPTPEQAAKERAEIERRMKIDNSLGKFAAGGANCSYWCGDKVCRKDAK